MHWEAVQQMMEVWVYELESREKELSQKYVFGTVSVSQSIIETLSCLVLTVLSER